MTDGEIEKVLNEKFGGAIRVVRIDRTLPKSQAVYIELLRDVVNSELVRLLRDVVPVLKANGLHGVAFIWSEFVIKKD